MFFIKLLLFFVSSIGINAGKKRSWGKAKGINAGDGEIKVEIYDGKWVTYCYVDLLKLVMVSYLYDIVGAKTWAFALGLKSNFLITMRLRRRKYGKRPRNR